MMKVNLVAKIFLTATAIVTITASIAQAQVPPKVETPPNMEHQMSSSNNHGIPEIPGLNLTEEQRNKIQEIHENNRSQIEGILTSEQRQSLKAAMESQKNPKEVMESLNLSDQQKQQLRSQIESERKQILEILTPSQQEQVRQHMQQMRDADGNGANPPFDPRLPH